MTDENDLSCQEKISQVQEGLRIFSEQFGQNDLVKQAFFDILLEAIYNAEEKIATKGNSVSVPSTAQQESNTHFEHFGAGEMPTYEIE